MTLVPASSHGSTFNGGTITAALTITDPTDETHLAVNGVAGQSADVVRINAEGVAVADTFLRIDQHGNVVIQSGGTHQEASLQLVDTTVGNPGTITLDTFTGVGLSPEASANTVFTVTPLTGHSGSTLDVQSTVGAHTLRASADNKLGFFNHAVAAQPAAIPDAAGGAIIDVEGRAALNALLAAMRTLGLIAT